MQQKQSTKHDVTPPKNKEAFIQLLFRVKIRDSSGLPAADFDCGG